MAVKRDVSLSKEKLMDRRTFLISSGVTGLGALLASPDSAHAVEPQSPETLSWNTGELQFTFSLSKGYLRQHIFLPSGIQAPGNSAHWSGVEVGLLCSGEDSPDSGMKQAGGSPGQRLQFVAKEEQQSGRGKTLTLRHKDADLHLDIQSHYEAFDGLPVVRRHVEIVNTGAEPVGIEYLSSAMLHGLVLSSARCRRRSGELQHGVGHASAHPSERAFGPPRCAGSGSGKGGHPCL